MKERFEGLGQRLAGGLRRGWGAVKRHPWRTIAALPAALVLYVAVLYPFTPSIGDIRKSRQEQPSVVLSADGKELAVFKRANRDWVKLADISPKAVEALLATEDKRFYEHHGIDFTRTAKAVVNTLFLGEIQGGSTITQQLARNIYPEEIGRQQTVTRKIKEAITALKIEAIYSKDEILETYLNSVSFLYNAWGIEMAARTYFDKPASKLNELEAATLIGMLKGTSYYNPVLNPERALERRNTVLAQMVKGNKLTAERYAVLKSQPMKLEFERQPEFNGNAPHLTEYLRKWLLEWADQHDYNIYADGLVVRTTIDSRLQQMANQAVKRQGDALQAVADVEWSRSGNSFLGTDPQNYVRAANKAAAFDYFWGSNAELLNEFVRGSAEFQALRQQGLDGKDALAQLKADTKFMADLRRQKTTLQAGFLAIEPSTGHIKAWVGSRDYNEDKFDHVQQARRQPGSTFKPFVYGAAFEMGHQPTETLMDQPVAIQIDRNQVWRPGDIEGAPTNQPMSLRDGLAKSKNTITAQLMMQVGPSRVAALARAMGVRQSKLNEVPSLALGTSPVTLKEMVTSFATIANSGTYIEPTLVTAIEDRQKNVLASFGGKPSEQALSAQAAQTLLDVLRGVVDGGTAVGLRPRFQLTGDLAGKTGTTQDNTDGWFMLMHPQLVAGAWTGFNDNRVTMRSSYWGQGAHNALLLVGDFMQQAQKAGVIDAKAQFSAPRLKDLEQPVFQGVRDWWNSVFTTPPSESDPPVATLPPVKLEPPLLEAPPARLDYPPTAPPLPSPAAAVSVDAPLISGPERVPAFPRPLVEPARPAESVGGMQVYRSAEPARSAEVPLTGGGGGQVLVPRSPPMEPVRPSPSSRAVSPPPPLSQTPPPPPSPSASPGSAGSPASAYSSAMGGNAGSPGSGAFGTSSTRETVIVVPREDAPASAAGSANVSSPSTSTAPAPDATSMGAPPVPSADVGVTP